MSGGFLLQQASTVISGAVSDEVLVSVPAGSRARVAGVYVMSDAAQVIDIEADDTADVLKWRVYCGANGGVESVAPTGQFLFAGADGQDITVTAESGNAFVAILYTLV